MELINLTSTYIETKNKLWHVQLQLFGPNMCNYYCLAGFLLVFRPENTENK